ncbi:MAG: sulfatase [Candidatus Rokubacteria bacterium]|nr:sulfatase [Candidatus Rokubacteria bacterium]
MRAPRVLLLTLLVGLSAWSALEVRAHPEPDARPNVLLITIDSLRPDHLSAYGYPKPTSPTLERLARSGVRFTQVINQASWTSAALVSTLTSVYPTAHGVHDHRARLAPGTETPLVRLRRAGYAVPGLSYLIALPEFEHLGFEPVTDRDPERWLEANARRPFFLWLHYEGPHLPYNPPPPYDRMFAPGGEPFPAALLKRVQPFLGQPIVQKGEVALRPEDRRVLSALYDGKIRRTDEEVGRLLGVIERLGLGDKTVVVVSADHGEELLDHGFVGHASTSLAGTLYDEVIRVPLIMTGPGLPRGRVVTTQVEGIDVLPTILDVLGVDRPSSFQGRSLLPLIRGQSRAFAERAFSETTVCGRSCPEGREQPRLQALRRPPWKFIQRREPSGQVQEELYYLPSDPREQRDVARRHPEVVARLRGELTRWAAVNLAKAVELQAPPEATGHAATEPPTIVRPRGRVAFGQSGGRIVIEWVGSTDGRYVLEYEVGQGKYRLKGSFPVAGRSKEFGPLNSSVWNLLPLYNPFRFRLRPEGCQGQGCWTEWVSFMVEPANGPVSR